MRNAPDGWRCWRPILWWLQELLAKLVRRRHGMPATPSSSAHYLVIASSHSTPLVFDDIVQSSAGDDFIYST